MAKKRVYKRYPQEFKEEAVALVTEQGYTVKEAAESLGIKPGLLRTWQERLESKRQPLTETEREELKRLRKENKELKLEKAILKKASALFAKEMK